MSVITQRHGIAQQDYTSEKLLNIQQRNAQCNRKKRKTTRLKLSKLLYKNKQNMTFYFLWLDRFGIEFTFLPKVHHIQMEQYQIIFAHNI